MNSEICVLVLVSLLILLAIRGYMALTVRLSLTKKMRKHYKSEYCLIDRWFFISIPYLVKSKYSKSEKRTIDYPLIMLIYRYLNIINHLLFFAEFILLVLLFLKLMDSFYLYLLIKFFFIVYLVEFLALALVEFLENKKYHLNRYK